MKELTLESSIRDLLGLLAREANDNLERLTNAYSTGRMGEIDILIEEITRHKTTLEYVSDRVG